MSNSTEHPRNGETYHAYYFGFDGTGTPVDKVLKAVARAGACYHHTEHWADDDGQTCHMDQIQLAADEAAAELIALRALVGELVDVVASQREKLIDHTNLYDPRFDGDEPDAHVVNLIARAREATQ